MSCRKRTFFTYPHHIGCGEYHLKLRFLVALDRNLVYTVKFIAFQVGFYPRRAGILRST